VCALYWYYLLVLIICRERAAMFLKTISVVRASNQHAVWVSVSVFVQ